MNTRTTLGAWDARSARRNATKDGHVRLVTREGRIASILPWQTLSHQLSARMLWQLVRLKGEEKNRVVDLSMSNLGCGWRCNFLTPRHENSTQLASASGRFAFKAFMDGKKLESDFGYTLTCSMAGWRRSFSCFQQLRMEMGCLFLWSKLFFRLC